MPSEAAAYPGRHWQGTWRGRVLDLGNGAPTGSQIVLTLHSCHCAKSEVMTVRCTITKVQAFVRQGTLRAATSELSKNLGWLTGKFILRHLLLGEEKRPNSRPVLFPWSQEPEPEPVIADTVVAVPSFAYPAIDKHQVPTERSFLES